MKNGLAATLSRVAIAGALAVATLGFGLVGLCGGVFTVLSAVTNLPFLTIALPSLLVGGGLAWLFGWLLLRSPDEDA
jgi:hypothetical protein